MNPPQDDFSPAEAGRSGGAPRERAEIWRLPLPPMKKIADAGDLLYKTLDEGQKRRLAVLTHMDRRFGGREGWRRHRFERDMGMDRDFDRDHRNGRDRMTVTAPPTGAARAALRARDRAPIRHWQKPLKSSGFLPFRRSTKGRENLRRLLDIPGSLC